MATKTIVTIDHTQWKDGASSFHTNVTNLFQNVLCLYNHLLYIYHWSVCADVHIQAQPFPMSVSFLVFTSML